MNKSPGSRVTMVPETEPDAVVPILIPPPSQTKVPSPTAKEWGKGQPKECRSCGNEPLSHFVPHGERGGCIVADHRSAEMRPMRSDSGWSRFLAVKLAGCSA